jgi:hypothetical protein
VIVAVVRHNAALVDFFVAASIEKQQRFGEMTMATHQNVCAYIQIQET